MTTKTESRRSQARELPHDRRADEILEFVFNDEEDALCNERFALTHQRDMPALQEYLREMFELDSRSGDVRWH